MAEVRFPDREGTRTERFRSRPSTILSDSRSGVPDFVHPQQRAFINEREFNPTRSLKSPLHSSLFLSPSHLIMARKSNSSRQHSTPPRRSPRFSGSSNAPPPPPPPLSPPPPYQFATPQQTMAYAMSNDTWSVEAQNGSDDEEDPAPPLAQVRLETEDSNATAEVRVLPLMLWIETQSLPFRWFPSWLRSFGPFDLFVASVLLLADRDPHLPSTPSHLENTRRDATYSKNTSNHNPHR